MFAQEGAAGGYGSLIFLALMIAVFYFLIIFPLSLYARVRERQLSAAQA